MTLESTNGLRERLMHGALIPQGPYRGCVLTWGKYANKTETFLWDPASPSRLFRILNTWAGGTRNLEGASLTWDDEGQLIVVGPSATVGAPGVDTWRIFPSSLNYPPLQSVPPTPPSSACYAEITGNAWRANQAMSLARYRPTILSLAKGLMSATTADRSTIVLGGMTSSALNDGWEFWQALSPRSAPGGSSWGATFAPSIGHPHADPTPNQLYAVQGGLAETQTEATPCVVQLATSGPPGQAFVKSVIIAQDSNSSYSTPPSTSNSAGLSTVVRPQYGATPSSWELWRAGASTLERTQGSLVLRHDRDGIGSFNGKNRIISTGGLYYNPSGASPGWSTQYGLFEYLIPSQTKPQDGSWVFISIPGQAQLQIGRIDNSMVALPTGDIFVVGGSRMLSGTFIPNATTPYGLPTTPVRAPQLVQPGRAGQPASTWSVTTMADAPNQLAFGGGWAVRKHGHAAVLLPDGRIMVTGGDTSGYGPGSEGYSFTGDIFSPPYLFQGFRPTIASIPNPPTTFGQVFSLAVGRLSDEVIDSVVLLRPASTAYGFDSSQRYIELEFTLGNYDPVMGTQDVNATSPADDLGPPGYYMLFVVSHLSTAPQARVPSVAQFIYLN